MSRNIEIEESNQETKKEDIQKNNDNFLNENDDINIDLQ